MKSETGAIVSTGRVSRDGLGGMVNLSAGRLPEETAELLEALDFADLYACRMAQKRRTTVFR